jgi:hypothetical protein
MQLNALGEINQITEDDYINSSPYNELLPLFEKAEGYCYYNQIKSVDETLGKTSRLYLPIETDTEFWHPELNVNQPNRVISQCLTIQHRAINRAEGVIFTHPDSAPIARHPLVKSGFTPIDYLQHIGIPAKIERSEYSLNLPVIQFDLYGFFLTAELYRIVLGEFKRDINQLVLARRDDNASIEMGRRLIASTVLKGNRAEQYVLMPWVVQLYQYNFQAAIAFYDCCAVHGNTNYATFCANSGIKLKYKDNFTSQEKSRMQLQYLSKPDEFDNYALGDLQCYEALHGNMDKFQTIYNSLDINNYFESPRLTIGATVARILRSSMLKHLGLELKDKNQVIELCRYGTSAHIKTMKSTAVYNAKVDGGRCRNNRPIDISVHRPLADADIAGCYGNGLKHQDFPFGRPLIIDYPIKSDNNNYLTLRKFLKKYCKELVPGLWQARVSTPKGYTLKYPQDFLISWVPPKDPSKIPTDSDLQEIDWYSEDNIGITKIFTDEIHLALINQEFLDWLDNTASARQKKELLDNLVVITAMFYPASEKCENVIEFFQSIQEHNGQNECLADVKKRKSRKVSIEQECHSWLSVNLGELLVGRLLLARSKYSKHNPDEKPLNELYKLCINTIYGDMVSPFFDIGNVVVGNNITARARAMAWYMEKGLNGFQTITDGCAFELNRVIHKDIQKVTASEVMTTYTSSSDAHYKVKPIGSVDRIETEMLEDGLGLIIYQADKITRLDNNLAKQWLENQIPLHLKTIFPNVPVIDKFSFEIKDIYDAGAFHGTANYKFRKGKKTEQGKMRSYSKKHDYNAFTLTGDELQLIFTEYKPSEQFLDSLLLCPIAVQRSHPYIATKILKTGEYKAHYESRWIKSEAFPGCTVEMGRLLRECSLTQFTFKSLAQFQSWEREAKRLRQLTGHTYESWFLNDDGTLNFKAMVVRLDTLIRSGEMRFSTSRPTAAQRHLAREYEEHPGYPALMKVKHQLGVRYGFLPSDSDEFETVVELNYPDLDAITD